MIQTEFNCGPLAFNMDSVTIRSQKCQGPLKLDYNFTTGKRDVIMLI